MNTDAEIRSILSEDLSRETRRALFDWDPDPFKSDAWGLTWRPLTHHVTLYKNDQPVSHVGLVREIIRVGQELIEVAGLGGIITIPAAQGCGLAQRAIAEAVKILVGEWRISHALLFCFPARLSFYEQLGWVRRKEPVWISQPGGRVAMPTLSLVQAWSGAQWPAGEIDMNGLPW